jgi:hypothetical protein
VHPWINVAGAVVTAVVVIVVGVLATWDVAVRKPLGILRDHRDAGHRPSAIDLL